MTGLLLREVSLFFVLIFSWMNPISLEMASPDYIENNLGQYKNYEPLQSSLSYTPPPPSCHLTHLEYVARHGNKVPDGNSLQSFTELQNSIQNFLSAGGQFNPEYSWMGSWKNPYVQGQAGLLTPIGEEQHYRTAKRMLNSYPDVMNMSYNPNRYHFQETKISRVGVSAASFAFGMMEGKGILGETHFSPPYIYSNSFGIDRDLVFFGPCPTYLNEVLLNETAFEQQVLFYETMEPNALELSKRLGTYPIWTLSIEDYLSMWEVCQVQAANFNNYSQFCSIWIKDDIDDLAFYEDLEFYYKRGYGHEIDYLIAVRLMNEIFGNINESLTNLQSYTKECGPDMSSPKLDNPSCEEMVNNAPYQLAGSFRFGHGETISPLLAWFGLYNTPSSLMRFDTPPHKRDTREWKTSVLIPYASNINLAVYSCGEVGNVTSALVKVLHNEKELILPCCDDVYCPWSKMVEWYASLLDHQYDHLCI